MCGSKKTVFDSNQRAKNLVIATMHAKTYDVQTPAGVVVTAPHLVPFVRKRTLMEEFFLFFPIDYLIRNLNGAWRRGERPSV